MRIRKGDNARSMTRSMRSLPSLSCVLFARRTSNGIPCWPARNVYYSPVESAQSQVSDQQSSSIKTKTIRPPKESDLPNLSNYP